MTDPKTQPLGADGFPINPISGPGAPGAVRPGAAGAAPAPADAARPKPRFVDAAAKLVTLNDALDYDGRTFDRIGVMKLTVGTYRAHVEAGGKTDILALPMFTDSTGTAVPAEILDALSVPDSQALIEAASGFLNGPPKAETAPASALPNGAPSPG